MSDIRTFIQFTGLVDVNLCNRSWRQYLLCFDSDKSTHFCLGTVTDAFLEKDNGVTHANMFFFLESHFYFESAEEIQYPDTKFFSYHTQRSKAVPGDALYANMTTF